MIKKNNQSFSFAKGSQVIEKIYKGTLVIYEGLKKLIVSGVPPLTLVKSGGKDLVDYKIYGNSVQDGTPTPDTPIEIESVGERTKNLLNKNTSQRGYVNTSGTVVFTESYDCYVSEKIYVKPSTTYTYSGMGDVAGKTVGRTGYQYDENDNPITPLGRSNGAKVTFTTAENCAYVVLIYRTDAEIPMLSETETDYEPYGYKIPVKVSGKNLFNKNATPTSGGGYTSYYDVVQTDTGVKFVFTKNFTSTGAYLTSKWVIGKLSAYVGKTITYSFDYLSSGHGSRAHIYTANAKGDTNEALVLQSSIANGTSIKKNSKKITQSIVDNNEDYPYIVVMFYILAGTSISIGDYTEFSNVCVYDSDYNSTLEYEPYVEPTITNIYLNEPLTINDYIDYKNQVLSKNGVEETIELPNIPTIKGTTVIEVLTDVTPSNMEVIYKGKGE